MRNKNFEDLTTYLNGKLEHIFNHFRNRYTLPSQVPSGHNGPHHDSVNNARVLSHLLITAFHLYKLSDEKKYLEWIRLSVEEIFKYIDPRTHTYINRCNNGKDPYNGLIGQVWIVQSLLFIFDFLSSKQIDSGIRVPLQRHHYNRHPGLWEYPVYDGHELKFLPSFTLNQQIWFTAIVSEYNRKTGDTLFEEDLHHISRNIVLTGNKHLLKQTMPGLNKLNVTILTKVFRRKIIAEIVNRVCRKRSSIDLAYTPFTIWGWFYTDIFKEHCTHNRITEIAKQNFNGVTQFHFHNPYAWGYNLSGIEIALNYLHIKKNVSNAEMETISKLVHANLQNPPSFKIPDDVTFMARTYETVFLLEKLGAV